MKHLLLLVLVTGCSFGQATFDAEESSSGEFDLVAEPGDVETGTLPPPRTGAESSDSGVGGGGVGGGGGGGGGSSEDTGEDASSSSSSSTDGGSDESSTGAAVCGPYASCFGDDPLGCGPCPGSCLLDDAQCDGQECGNVCAPSCASDEDCPDGGLCLVDDHGVSLCVLDCSEDPCPDGMVCSSWIYGDKSGPACMWEPA